jgi:hypothetical protein
MARLVSFRGDAKHRTSDAQLRIGEGRAELSNFGLPGSALRAAPERQPAPGITAGLEKRLEPRYTG